MDDATVGASVNLKESLRYNTDQRPQPLTFSERTGHTLPRVNNPLQPYLDDVEMFTTKNKMKINKNKTKVMKFTRARKLDFPLEVSFSDNVNLEYLTEIKLLGVVISDNLSWQSNTDFICKKAMQKMWLLRSMKLSGLNHLELIDAYCKEIRSLLELAVPVWHSALTKKQEAKIERVQKAALAIILTENYHSYEVACTIAQVEPLGSRRDGICTKFIKKNLASSSPLLTQLRKSANTRSNTSVNEFFFAELKLLEKAAYPILLDLQMAAKSEKKFKLVFHSTLLLSQTFLT